MRLKIITVFTMFCVVLLFVAGCAGADQTDFESGTAAVSPSPSYSPIPTATLDAAAFSSAEDYLNIAPQPGVVAYNRVEAFIQAHDFLDAYQDAIADEVFSDQELLVLAQMAANAEASLYNTGDHNVFGIAQQIDQLAKYAVYGELEAARTALLELQRMLPRRPQP